MGTRTLISIVGFVALHISVILTIVAISTHDWERVEDTTGNLLNLDPNSVYGIVDQGNNCEIGLWKACCDDVCVTIDAQDKTSKLKATIGLIIAGTILVAIGTSIMYVFLCSTKFKNSVPVASGIALIVSLGACAEIACIIVYGVSYNDDASKVPSGSPIKVSLGWSYWLAVAGTILADLSSGTTLAQIYFMSRRQSGYEDI